MITDFKKKVYLTIDDAPSADFSQKVTFLKKHNIPAVFFCIGNLLEKRSAAVIESIKQGFIIANHSYSHPSFSKVSLRQCQTEIFKTHKIIDSLYIEAGVKRPVNWFRFPYGDKGDYKNGRVFSRWRIGSRSRKMKIQNMLESLNYTQPVFDQISYSFMKKAKLWKDLDWSWTFDVMEWAMLEKRPTLKLRDINAIIDRLRQKVPKDCRGNLGREKRWLESRSAELLLLHDHEKTTDHFYTIMHELMKMPLQFSEV